MKEVSLEDALRAIGSDLQRNRVAGLEGTAVVTFVKIGRSMKRTDNI